MCSVADAVYTCGLTMQPMQPFKCPHCGAPPPPGYVPPSGQFGYFCTYCRQQSVHGAPAPPPQAQLPAIIVIQGPGHEHDHHYDHHHQAAIAHAHVARSASWIVWVVIVLVVSLGGSGAAFMNCTKHSAILSGLVWDGSEPLHCSGNDRVEVSGVEATFNAGAAIIADGNCHVRCTDCNLTAPTAIESSGNAQVTIVNGSVKGTILLADASGNSRVTISGNVTVSGQVRERANAKVSAPQPPPVAATAAPPAVTPALAPTPMPTPAAAAKTAKTPAPTKRTTPK